MVCRTPKYIQLMLISAISTCVELHGFGDDEFHPISKTGSNLTSSGGIGYTVVDTLDTLILMGLDDELARARTWVQDKLSFDQDGDYNVFEVHHFASGINSVSNYIWHS